MVGSGTLWKKVGDIMFMGEYRHNIDEKGRIVIPNKFRAQLEDTFVLVRGLENCLYLYAYADWEKLVGKLNTLPFTKKDARTFIRSFFSGACECEFDKQGRTCITLPLIKHANISKECIIVGANDRIEIWSKENWEQFMDDNRGTLSDIAENLFMDVNEG